MIRALLQQQFPRINVRGVADAENTGNFVVADDKDHFVLSPYGFVSTTERQQALLERIQRRYGTPRPST